MCFSVLNSTCSTPGNGSQFVYEDIQITVFITRGCLLEKQKCMQSNLVFGRECNSFMYSTKQMYTWDEHITTETEILLGNKYYCESLNTGTVY